MSKVDPAFYANITQPSSRTRSRAVPIESFPLEKRRISRNTLLDPWCYVINTQGLSAAKFRDADADAGKYYYIHIDAYDTSPTTTDIINEVSPLLVNPSEFEIGAYYTYIVADIVGKDRETNKTVVLSQPAPAPVQGRVPQLYAAKTINMYEFGTKHQQIMYRKAIQDEALFAEFEKTYKNVQYRIYATGEIMCVNANTLIFNFISGTYKMKKHMTKTRVKYEHAYFTYMMRNISPKYTNILFQQTALIVEDALPLTRRELSRLRRRNVPVFLFDTPRQCYQMRNAVNQRKEALQDIYERVSNVQ